MHLFRRKAQKMESVQRPIQGREGELLPCPCGRHAELDWFDGGWHVCCPVFKLDDGIHGIPDGAPKSERFSFFDLPNEDAAIKVWNDRVRRWNAQHPGG